MNVHLVKSNGVDRDLCGQINEVLINTPGPISFTEDRSSISFDKGVLGWNHIFYECQKYRGRRGYSDNDFIVLLTSNPGIGVGPS